MVKNKGSIVFGGLLSLLIFFSCLSAWFTHLYICFNEKLWGFLIAGAIMFPIAIVHGFGIWLGIW